MQIVSQNLAVARFGHVEVVRGARGRNEQLEAASSPTATSSNKAAADTLEISPAAEAHLAAEDERTNPSENEKSLTAEASSDSESTKENGPSKNGGSDAPQTEKLTEEQQEVVDELKTTDREVRTHEQAHLAAAGSFAKGGPTFTYQKGPDGQQYAVGGEVSIDTSSVPGDPEATIAKARVIRAAASAPAEPSSQDRAVAAAATKLEIQATQELQQQEVEATDEDPSKTTSGLRKFLTSEEEPSETSVEITAGLLLDLIG